MVGGIYHDPTYDIVYTITELRYDPETDRILATRADLDYPCYGMDECTLWVSDAHEAHQELWAPPPPVTPSVALSASHHYRREWRIFLLSFGREYKRLGGKLTRANCIMMESAFGHGYHAADMRRLFHGR